MAFTTRTITNSQPFLNADGSPCAGDVRFELSDVLANDGAVVVPNPVIATLDNTGTFTQTVVANDDADTIPTGSTWLVTLDFYEVEPVTYSIVVPSAGSGDINLASLLPGVPQVS